MRVYEMGPRAPLYTCRGRAVGLLHVWRCWARLPYPDTVFAFPPCQTCNRPRPMRIAASRGSGFSREICIHSRLKSLLQAIPFGTRRFNLDCGSCGQRSFLLRRPASDCCTPWRGSRICLPLHSHAALEQRWSVNVAARAGAVAGGPRSRHRPHR